MDGNIPKAVIDYADKYVKDLPISIREHAIVRNIIAHWQWKKHLEFITSPQSETYWAS